jgi:hypothetical protein
MYLNYTNERLKELINILNGVRDYELPYNYYMDFTDIILILQTLLEKDDNNGT